MEIKVSGRKTTVTDALRAHVDEKIGEALKVFDIEPMTADVVLRYEKNPSNPNPAIVEVTVYRLNATAVAYYDIDGPESVLHHLGASAADTYITRHEVDDIVTVVHINREEADTWQP